jgi:hypothetical protein
MMKPSRQLTIDEAIGEFQALLQEQLGDVPPGACGPPQTPEEAEARRFQMAEHLVRLACPDRTLCADYRCRRDAICRHLAFVLTRQRTGKSGHPRRPPGAEAVRYAIWVYMSARRG